MTRDLSGDFRNIEDGASSLVDYFIESVHISLLGCGIYRSSAERLPSFLLPAFLIVYYKEGMTELRHGSETTVLQPGSCFIFRPNDIYSGRRISDSPICFAYLQFDVAPFMERYNFRTIARVSADTIFEKPQYHLLGKMLETLAEDDPKRRGRAGMLRQLVKVILGQMIYDQAVQENDAELLQKGRDSRIINHAFQYTAEHLSSPIVIGDIIKDGKTSKTSLERAFRNMLGTTPQRALLRFKIERSMEMLLQNTPLKDIVKALGFSSVFHYSNTFKMITGVRPTDYRNAITKKPEKPAGGPD